jgi:hypothetical protein
METIWLSITGLHERRGGVMADWRSSEERKADLKAEDMRIKGQDYNVLKGLDWDEQEELMPNGKDDMGDFSFLLGDDE